MSNTPQAVLDLVEHFERNIESYRGAGYNEAQVRSEFLDPMFEALGWDMANRAGHAEAYKDVIHEDAIKVGGATKAPDYCFRIGGTRKFFVEAKRPSVDIVYDADSAYQLRRYAWSSKLPLSILTDFEEFAVYDCRFRPNRADKASEGRIFYMKCGDYAQRWQEIAEIFSKESVLRGSFDKFAERARGKRGTSEVDSEFLREIEKWREKLARNLSLRNASVTVPSLNTAVQCTIDRIIFLRMCEDRGIETYGQLQALVNGEHTYRRLLEVFYNADEKYNSGLFHFRAEKGRPSLPDELTPELKLDDDVLKEILGSVYYPRSPYEFSVLPPEILGNVYEQFLGKVIRLTAGHHARVEEKPEVRKAGGVYYTPQYIVDYIVQNTVGKLCEGKTPGEISELRILDPACGSGSFLLGAYKFLLAWHRDWYLKEMSSANVDAASGRVLTKRQDAASTSDAPNCFDPSQPIEFVAGNLPHWRQEGVTYFVTFRCADSLPQEKIRLWEKEKAEWLAANPEPHAPEKRKEYYDRFVERVERWLDAGYGKCRLADSGARAIVEDALRFFDGQRYRLGAFIVMPNHVHVLVSPLAQERLSDILHAWKSFTAKKLNNLLQLSGAFWQKESFDHIVRDPSHLERAQQYISDNPRRADAASSRVAQERQDVASASGVDAASGRVLTNRQDPASALGVDAASGRVLTNRQDAASTIYQGRGGQWLLSTAEKKRILLNNIYGVDIDPQAVEVTKLSLLLKVLEDESSETLAQTLRSRHERALPDLDGNIKCGNSLIGPDFYEGKDPNSFSDQDRRRINAFDWKAEFPEVFGRKGRVDAASGRVAQKRQDAASTLTGGFDAVIGNPPYGRDILSEYKSYFEVKYSALQYKVDSYVLFVEKGFYALRPRGTLGFIIPNTWLNTERFRNLRRLLLDKTWIRSIVNLGKGVFHAANVDTLLLFFDRGRGDRVQVIDASDEAMGHLRLSRPRQSFAVDQLDWRQNPDLTFEVHVNPVFKRICGRMQGRSCPLGEIVEVSQGLIPYGNKEDSRRNPYLARKKSGAEWKKLLDKGACVSRYALSWNGTYVKYGPWLYTANQPRFYESDKLLVQRHRNPSLRRRIVATFDSQKYYFKDNLCGLITAGKPYELKYLLGIVNSSLMNEYYKRNYTEVSLNPVYLRKLPIAKIEFSDASQTQGHDQMVSLVDQMLELHKRLAKAKAAQEKTSLEREIQQTDDQIDRLVYELYGLTDEEIKIVEEARP